MRHGAFVSKQYQEFSISNSVRAVCLTATEKFRSCETVLERKVCTHQPPVRTCRTLGCRFPGLVKRGKPQYLRTGGKRPRPDCRKICRSLRSPRCIITPGRPARLRNDDLLPRIQSFQRLHLRGKHIQRPGYRNMFPIGVNVRHQQITRSEPIALS